MIAPFREGSTHHLYSNSFLHIRPAPEYASGEVVLASLMRNIGFGSTNEGQVPRNGAALQKRVQKRSFTLQPRLSSDTWQGVLEGPLKSPKQPQQSSKHFLQLCPLVPDCALYSSSARLTANSWNPGELVKRIVSFGSSDYSAACRVWERLFVALSVDRDSDDPWAVSLQDEFKAWRVEETEWSLQELEANSSIDRWRLGGGDSAARQFLGDLALLFELKPLLTRRQWVSMLESLLRLACATHVLWLCRANQHAFKLLVDALEGECPPDERTIRGRLGVSAQRFWRYGQPAMETIDQVVRDYLRARVGLNVFLHFAEECGLQIHTDAGDALESPDMIRNTALAFHARRKDFPLDEARTLIQRIVDSHPRDFAVKKGVGSNVKEFLRHCLGQRQTAEDGMRSYDQGYWLRKNGHHSGAKWVVSAGPVAVLLLVHCCSRRTIGPATTDDLCRHLGEYGIMLRSDDVTGAADLGPTLRRMGLVTDSPDAEGGMLIYNPFRLMETVLP
jgi:hypothetical protein